MLRISNCISWVLRIPVSSVSCQEAMTLVIKPCALIPDLVHMCCALVPEMLCHLSHCTDCPKCGKVLRLPLRSYRLYNRISQFRFDKSVTQIDSSNASERIEAVSSSPMNKRSSWKNLELNTKCQCQTPHNRTGEQNGSSKLYWTRRSQCATWLDSVQVSGVMPSGLQFTCIMWRQ